MRLMDIWHRDYAHELLIELPDPLNNTVVHFKQFVTQQKDRIERVKKLLTEQWKDNAFKIIESERNDSDLDKEQIPVF